MDGSWTVSLLLTIVIVATAIAIGLMAIITIARQRASLDLDHSDQLVLMIGDRRLLKFGFGLQAFVHYCGMPAAGVFSIYAGNGNLYYPVDHPEIEVWGKRFSVTKVTPTRLTLKYCGDGPRRGLLAQCVGLE